MTKRGTTLAAFACMLLPVAANAIPVTITWNGQLTGYASEGDGFPEPPFSTSISGTITYDTDSLPAADSGNPPEIFSVSGGDFIHSTINWAGGLFQPVVAGGIPLDSLLIVDSDNDQYSITDTWSFLDPSGEVQHDALMNFDLFGMPDLFTVGAGIATAASIPDSTLLFFGGGGYGDLTLQFGPGEINGFIANFQIDSFNVAATSVPEPGTVTLMLAGLLALGAARRLRR